VEEQMTRTECRRRVLCGERVEEERKRARDAGEDVAEFMWDEGMKLLERVDGIREIRRERMDEKEGEELVGEQGVEGVHSMQWRVVATLMPEGGQDDVVEGEGGKGNEGESGGDAMSG